MSSFDSSPLNNVGVANNVQVGVTAGGGVSAGNFFDDLDPLNKK